jgi:hypothetical protein
MNNSIALRKKIAINDNILIEKKIKLFVNYSKKGFKTYFIYTKIIENKYLPTIKSNLFP